MCRRTRVKRVNYGGRTRLRTPQVEWVWTDRAHRGDRCTPVDLDINLTYFNLFTFYVTEPAWPKSSRRAISVHRVPVPRPTVSFSCQVVGSRGHPWRRGLRQSSSRVSVRYRCSICDRKGQFRKSENQREGNSWKPALMFRLPTSWQDSLSSL